MNLHVSNLNSNLIESDLQRLFGRFGEVNSVTLMRDKLNNRSLCHGFIEMPIQKQAEQAIATLDQLDVKGKRIRVTKVVYDPAPHASWAHSQDA